MAKAAQPIGPYSPYVSRNGLVFVSGQIGVDPDSGELVAGLEKQTKQIMSNLQAVLQAADCDFSNLLKATIYLTNIDDFATVNDIYGQTLTDNRPARATVAVQALPKGALVEIDAVAYKG